MTFQDQPLPKRPSRYPAPQQLADGYPSAEDTYAAGGANGNGRHGAFQGLAGQAGAPQQRPPWEEPGQRDIWDAPAQPSWGTGARPAASTHPPASTQPPATAQATASGQPSLRDTGAQRPGRNSGAKPPMPNIGAQRTLRNTGAQPSLWGTGAQRALRNSGAQPSLWGTGGQPALRDSGAHQALRDSGAQPSLWDTGAQRKLGDTGAQQAAWDAPAQQLPGPGPRHRAAGSSGSVPDGARRGARGAAGQRQSGCGLLAGAICGFLASAVALGVANLAAAFVRPQASPVIAVGGAFIDHTPPALKNFAVEKFGENDKNMLLLGMYVTIGLIAIVIGVLAWRRLSIGVAGIGMFGLFGAFVAITRPESRVTDIIPSVAGGIAGIAAIVILVRAGTSGAQAVVTRRRTARHGQA